MTNIAAELMTNWPAWVWGCMMTLTLGVLITLLFYRGWMLDEMNAKQKELHAEQEELRKEWEQFRVDQEAWHRHIEEQQRSPMALMHVSVFGLTIVGSVVRRNAANATMLIGTGVWFLLQGVDEVLLGNFFSNGWIEYPVLVLWWTGILLYLRRYEQGR